MKMKVPTSPVVGGPKIPNEKFAIGVAMSKNGVFAVNAQPNVTTTFKPTGLVQSGAYEPPEGRKERPTPHYSVKRHLTITLSLYGPQPRSVVFITKAQRA